jgi:hypothetical protein
MFRTDSTSSPSRRAWGALASVLAVLLLPAAGRAAERYALPGDQVAIYNLAGALRVQAGTDADVVVSVTRGGRDAARLRVERGPIGPRQTLRVVYPADRVVYGRGLGRSSTTLRVAPDGTFHGSTLLGRRVRVATWGPGLEAHADLEVSVPPGKKLGLYLAVGQVTVSNVAGDLRLDCAAAPVEVDGLRGRLDVDTGSGGVRIHDVQGDLLVDTGSGGCEISAVRAGRISLDTGSGRVEGEDLEARELRVDTGSGGVRFDRVRAPVIRVDTGSGGVDLALDADVDDLYVDTGSGGVTLLVPETLGAQLTLDVGSGPIRVEFPFQTLHSDNGFLQGVVGDGSGRIYVDTGSGGVTLRRR